MRHDEACPGPIPTTENRPRARPAHPVTGRRGRWRRSRSRSCASPRSARRPPCRQRRPFRNAVAAHLGEDHLGRVAAAPPAPPALRREQPHRHPQPPRQRRHRRFVGLQLERGPQATAPARSRPRLRSPPTSARAPPGGNRGHSPRRAHGALRMIDQPLSCRLPAPGPRSDDDLHPSPPWQRARCSRL